MRTEKANPKPGDQTWQQAIVKQSTKSTKEYRTDLGPVNSGQGLVGVGRGPAGGRPGTRRRPAGDLLEASRGPAEAGRGLTGLGRERTTSKRVAETKRHTGSKLGSLN